MEKSFTMAVGGDFVPSDLNEDRLIAGDVESTFGDLAEYFKKADLSFLNVECALTERGTPIKKCGPNLKGSPKAFETLKKIGINLIGLANNHSLDFGKIGLSFNRRTTVEIRAAVKVQTTRKSLLIPEVKSAVQLREKRK